MSPPDRPRDGPGGGDVPPNFRVGFLNRLLWETPLGLEADEAFVGRHLPAMRASGDFARMIDAYREQCDVLQAGYGEGAAIARDSRRTLRDLSN